MPRYVINVDTRTVHNADCSRVFKNVVPWPRFEYDGQGWCTYCLPHGLPVKPTRPTREQVIREHDRDRPMVVPDVPPVGDHVLPAPAALPPERIRAARAVQRQVQADLRRTHRRDGAA